MIRAAGLAWLAGLWALAGDAEPLPICVIERDDFEIKVRFLGDEAFHAIADIPFQAKCGNDDAYLHNVPTHSRR